jgi:hypothetical protein
MYDDSVNSRYVEIILIYSFSECKYLKYLCVFASISRQYLLHVQKRNRV